MTVYSVPGYEPEDLAQERRLALLQAGNPTGTLAKVVTDRHLITLLRSATRERHRALNDSVWDDSVQIPGGRDPADIVADRDELRQRGQTLTDRERRALVYVIAGIPYQRVRWIDNAVTRARRRLQ